MQICDFYFTHRHLIWPRKVTSMKWWFQSYNTIGFALGSRGKTKQKHAGRWTDYTKLPLDAKEHVLLWVWYTRMDLHLIQEWMMFHCYWLDHLLCLHLYKQHIKFHKLTLACSNSYKFLHAIRFHSYWCGGTVALSPHSCRITSLILISVYCLLRVSRVLLVSTWFPPDSSISFHFPKTCCRWFGYSKLP